MQGSMRHGCAVMLLLAGCSRCGVPDATPPTDPPQANVQPPALVPLPPNYFPLLPLPDDTSATEFGLGLTLGVDASGSPMVAFLWVDTNRDGNRSDTTACLVRWDAQTKEWKHVVKVAVVGDVDPTEPLSLARDVTTGRLGVAAAYAGPDGRYVVVALSDDGGDSWTTARATADLAAVPLLAPQPVLALEGGHLRLQWSTSDGRFERLGAEADPEALWSPAHRVESDGGRLLPPPATAIGPLATRRSPDGILVWHEP